METAGRQSIKQTLGELGISQTTYPFGPDWGSVKPYKASQNMVPKETGPHDMGTTRRLQFGQPPKPFEAKTLRYPETYVPPPTAVHPKKITVNVKLMGAGLDGLQVPVTVKSTGTVAEVITSAVENLKMSTGTNVPYSNLRVTGLFSESGRPLSAGYRLHSQGQVPQVKDGANFVLKVLV